MQELQRWIEDEETKRGYVRTKTPLMAKSDLYKISGHWDHYKDGMFVLGDEETDKEVFALRPMTCPFQCSLVAPHGCTMNDVWTLFFTVFIDIIHVELFSQKLISVRCLKN